MPISVENVFEQAIALAEQHLFERRFTANEHELWRLALERAKSRDV